MVFGILGISVLAEMSATPQKTKKRSLLALTSVRRLCSRLSDPMCSDCRNLDSLTTLKRIQLALKRINLPYASVHLRILNVLLKFTFS